MYESKKIQMCIKNGNITCEIFKIKKKILPYLISLLDWVAFPSNPVRIALIKKSTNN